MTGSTLITNVLLLAISIVGVKAAVRGIQSRDILAGALAAASVLATLIAVRLVLPLLPSSILWMNGTGPSRPGETVLAHLAIVALIEEIAKYVVVAPWRMPVPSISPSDPSPARPDSHRAAGRGLGFASAEHLLFLLLPVRLFLRRIPLAGALHIGTALLYSRPRILCRRRIYGTAPGTDILLVLLGTAIHLGYNLLLQGLDGLTVF
jgi:RsiW-degrading membrane proteinase PrsW (M82 family)